MAFRPNWYEDGPRRGGLRASMARWTGFRWLITLNIAAFVLQLALPDLVKGGSWFTEGLVLRAWWPPTPFGPLHDWPGLQDFNWFFPLQLVTYSFLHAGVSHILFNLLYLWIFGPELEAELGKRGFLRLYLGGAIFGGLLQWALWLATGSGGVVLGASGAVYTVMTLFALKWPHRQILLYFVIPIPVWLLVAGRVVFDAVDLLQGTGGATAVLVHLGGAAFGVGWWKGAGLLTAALDRRRRLKALQDFQEASNDRREMDRILAKIQSSGLGSLDARERGFLERRSRELRGQGRG